MRDTGDLHALARHWRRGQLSRYALLALPLGFVVTLWLWQLAQMHLWHCTLWGMCAWLLAIVVTDVLRARRRVTASRLALHLNRRFESLQHSTGLLLSAPVSAVGQLQRDRVRVALTALLERKVIRRPNVSASLGLFALCLLLAAVLVNVPWLSATILDQVLRPSVAKTDTLVTVVESVIVDVRPPAYTGLNAYALNSPDVVVPEGSSLRLTVDAPGESEHLMANLQSSGEQLLYQGVHSGRWQSSWFEAAAQVYTLNAGDRTLNVVGVGLTHSVTTIPDTPPEITFHSPQVRRYVMDANRSSVPVEVELQLQDDYGLASVDMVITRAEGEGEQVSFAERRIPWLSYDQLDIDRATIRRTIEPTMLDMSPGSEVYVHFEVTDHRPQANVATSASLQFLWPKSDATLSVTLDNRVVDVVPEFFRSQRQIIIDSEALLAKATQITERAFAFRAQSLAFNQSALRLRYGAFLGEEQGGEPIAGAEVLGAGHYAGDGHDHSQEELAFFASREAFDDAQAAIEPYAHTHDQEEAATLFDEQTRDLLRRALRAMWASERQLRQFEVRASLPHQYEALDLIKRVQRRSRVFAARVGFKTRQPDLSRRLSAELDAIEMAGVVALATDRVDDRQLDSLLSELVMVPVLEPTLAQRVLDLVRQRSTAGDAPAVIAQAALLEWIANPACDECRAQLRQYWISQRPDALPRPVRPAAIEDWFSASR
ncbi:MAG: hypothetical protein AAGA84_02395 [Pseudomonadota bacterium]